MEIILAAALLPAIILMVYVYKHDKIEKEPFVLFAYFVCIWRAFLCAGRYFGGFVLRGSRLYEYSG